MSRRRYYSDYGRSGPTTQRGPNVLPYFVIAILAMLGWLYLRNGGQPQLAPPAPVQITVNGRLIDSYTGDPISGVEVQVQQSAGDSNSMANAPGSSGGGIVPGPNITVAGAQTATLPLAPQPTPLQTTVTAVDGSFVFQNMPDGAWLHVAQPGYAPQDLAVGGRTLIDIQLVPNTLRGKVLTPDGKPVAKAQIYSNGTSTLSDADGAFKLENISDHKLMVKAPGYRIANTEFGNVGEQNIQLEPFQAKAIYINADTVASPGKFYELIKMVDETELDAVIIDVKADTTGYVLYASKLPEVQMMGAANPVIADLRSVVDMLHQHNIYVIARQALFWDERLVAARPDLAIQSKSSDGPWEDAYQHHWANPHLPEVWAYNIAIAREVASFGVDEIQFDYVRFPSDGNLEDADYGQTNGQTRAKAISSFLKRAYEELSPLGVFISADVFGLSPIVSDDLGIGQQWEEIGSDIDYISPMAYPSHYADGFLDFDKPAEHPGEVVGYTIESGQAKLLGRRALVRPWLQDFTLYGIAYDASRVRGQIEAAEQLNTSGWMLWNFDNVYTSDALHKN